MELNLFLTIVGTGAAIVASIMAGYWALGKLVVAQFDKRLQEKFEAQDRQRDEGRRLWNERFERMDAQQTRLDTDFTKLMRELPSTYVRREDAIRENTTINAKLDALNARLEHLITRGIRG